MSFNIKNEATHRLARELATLTGETMTQAVTTALEERLERVRHHKKRAGLAERLLAIGRENASRMTAAERAVDHGELLYDERGLPRDC